MTRLNRQNNELYYANNEEEKFNSYESYVAETSAKYFITENKGHDKLFKEALY